MLEKDVSTTEKSYQKALKTLTQQNRPSKVLCTLMNWLESYRQTRKMGWSRAWNKYGLNTFQSFKLSPQEDMPLIQQGFALLEHVEGISDQAASFITALQQEKQLMAFLFFSEYCEDGMYYESITLSLGRKVKEQARFRDRLDIIFDAQIRNNQVQYLDRLRIYIDPFQTKKKEALWQHTFEHALPHTTHALFAELCTLSWMWEDQPDKHWQHWTSQYIDYFGARTFDLDTTFLHHPTAQRIQGESVCSTS